MNQIPTLSLSIFKNSLSKMTPDLELERTPLYHQQMIFTENEIKDNIEGVDEDTIRNYYILTDDTINNLLITLGFSYSGERRGFKIEELYKYLLDANENEDEITIIDLNTGIGKFHELIKNK